MSSAPSCPSATGLQSRQLPQPRPLGWSSLLPECNMHWYKSLQDLWGGYMWIITSRVYQEPRAIKKQHTQHTAGISLISLTACCSISGSSPLVKEPSQQLKPESMNIIVTTLYLSSSSMQKILFQYWGHAALTAETCKAWLLCWTGCNLTRWGW